MSTPRSLLLLLLAGSLSACQTPPQAPPAPPPAPAPDLAPAPVPEPAPAPPATAEGRQQAQKSALAAADLLQSGNEDAARQELKHALTLDAQNRLALNLMRQLSVDLATLGHDSFTYTVRPGDTLAVIAQRHLNDPFLFYLLARYNDIKVPRQLSTGQVIRVPGKAATRDFPSTLAQNAPPVQRPTPATVSVPTPVPAPPPPSPPSPASPTPADMAMHDGATAERAGDLTRALVAYHRADSLGQAGAGVKVEQVRGQLVSRYTLAARNAFSKQDLKGAVANWQQVLELEPANNTAHVELERSKSLEAKLSGLK